MKANTTHLGGAFHEFQTPCFVAAASFGAVLILAGCATEKPEGGLTRSGNALTDASRFQLGTIGIALPKAPASVGFEKSSGRIDYADDRAGMVAQRILVFEPTGHPQIDAAVSVPEAVIAPAASGIAALRAEKRTVPAATLSECETHVRQALAKASAQAELRDRILRAAADKGARQVIPA